MFHIELRPTGMASPSSKKKWLVMELLRYKKSLTSMIRLQTFIGLGLFMAVLGYISNIWLAVVVIFISLLLMDIIFHYIHLNRYGSFYTELGEACFEISNDMDHDLRILLNRVGNYVNLKDEALKNRVYTDMIECYDRVQTKFDLREAISDMAKSPKASTSTERKDP